MAHTTSPLVASLEQLEDSRIDRARRQQQGNILILSVLAIIRGARKFVAMENLGESNER